MSIIIDLKLCTLGVLFILSSKNYARGLFNVVNIIQNKYWLNKNYARENILQVPTYVVAQEIAWETQSIKSSLTALLVTQFNFLGNKNINNLTIKWYIKNNLQHTKVIFYDFIPFKALILLGLKKVNNHYIYIIFI